MNITFLELHLDEASFSVDRPFSPGAGTYSDDEDAAEGELDEATDGQEVEATDDGSAVPTKPLVVIGVLVVLVGLAALVKRIAGDDPEVEIETPEDDANRPVGVTVDE